MPSCGPGYHETKLSNLFGGVFSNQTSEVICAPDAQDTCSGLFGCAIDALGDAKGGDIAKATAQVVAQGAAFYATGGLSVVGDILTGVAVAEQNPDFLKAAQVADLATSAIDIGSALQNLEVSTMGFLDAIDDFSFGSVVDFTSDIIDDIDWASLTQVAQTGIQAFNTFQPQTAPQAIPVMSKVPQVVAGVGGAVARSGAAVGRSFFNKWPNLATAIQKLRNAGQNVSRSKLHSMLKRFGPQFLVTAGILSAQAVAELMMAGPGHRRMNPANAKALRRATRRIKSFHKLCGDADIIKRRPCRKR